LPNLARARASAARPFEGGVISGESGAAVKDDRRCHPIDYLCLRAVRKSTKRRNFSEYRSVADRKEFSIPAELVQRLDAVSAPVPGFPYGFFTPGCRR
jgi:hypothetical protein